VRRHIEADESASLPEIEALIKATHYPYKTAGEELDLLGKILRDADLAQMFSPVWIQQVVIGLAGERGVKPIEVLRAQAPFLDTLSFQTRWARQMFPQELIKAKIEEAEKLVRLLDGHSIACELAAKPSVIGLIFRGKSWPHTGSAPASRSIEADWAMCSTIYRPSLLVRVPTKPSILDEHHRKIFLPSLTGSGPQTPQLVADGRHP
jgi:hypothetical protein